MILDDRRSKNGDHQVREGRIDDVPRWLNWLLTVINRVGFPIVVAIYLGYVQLSVLAKVIEALNTTNSVLSEVRAVIKDNSEIMRGFHGRR